MDSREAFQTAAQIRAAKHAAGAEAVLGVYPECGWGEGVYVLLWESEEDSEDDPGARALDGWHCLPLQVERLLTRWGLVDFS